jgi:tetratricopeptide (TPR) repeat protein
MGFFRKEMIEFALDQETIQAIAEQKTAITSDPFNPLPYLQLAQLYRMQRKYDEALGLLLEAVRLEPAFAPAQRELALMYIVQGDLSAARHHADQAAASGDRHALDTLEQYEKSGSTTNT